MKRKNSLNGQGRNNKERMNENKTPQKYKQKCKQKKMSKITEQSDQRFV